MFEERECTLLLFIDRLSEFRTFRISERLEILLTRLRLSEFEWLIFEPYCPYCRIIVFTSILEDSELIFFKACLILSSIF